MGAHPPAPGGAVQPDPPSRLFGGDGRNQFLRLRAALQPRASAVLKGNGFGRFPRARTCSGHEVNRNGLKRQRRRVRINRRGRGGAQRQKWSWYRSVRHLPPPLHHAPRSGNSATEGAAYGTSGGRSFGEPRFPYGAVAMTVSAFVWTHWPCYFAIRLGQSSLAGVSGNRNRAACLSNRRVIPRGRNPDRRFGTLANAGTPAGPITRASAETAWL